MANPVFRFRLIHEQGGTYEISEPGGWADTKLSLTRDDNFHSLIENFEGSFFFYGSNGFDDGGIDFIRHIETTYGFDTPLEIDIDISVDGGLNFSDLFNGLYDFTMTEENNRNTITTAIKRNDFWSKFISRFETPVDIMSPLDMEGNSISTPSPIDVYMKSQKIQLIYQADSVQAQTAGSESAVTGIPSGTYLQVDWATENLAEIEEKFSLPVTTNPDLPAYFLFPEYGGNYRFQIKLYAYIVRFSALVPVGYYSVKAQSGPDWPTSSTNYVDFYLNVNGVEHALTHTVVSTLDGGTPGVDTSVSLFTYDDYIDLNPSDKVYFYGRMNATFNPTPAPGEAFIFIWNSGPDIGLNVNVLTYTSTIKITAQTVFPASTSDSFFIKDVASAVANRIIGRESCFVSSYFSQPFGCNWNYALMKGLQIRQYTLNQKPFFSSFSNWWNGANPIFNLGLGYQIQNGQDVIRVEEKAYFYNKNTLITFDNLNDVIRTYDEKSIINKIMIGYSKWESESLSGIDDPQTKKTYSTRLQTVGESITLYSEFIAASLAIEQTRRQSILKSKDYKLDNDTFIVSLTDTEVSPDVFLPETNENFTNIQNLLNADTRYNLRITPGRNMLRFVNFINGCLQSYLGSEYKFSSGEGNYDLIDTLSDSSCDTQGTLSEKGSITVDDDYLHLPDLIEFTIDMTFEQYVMIRNNRERAIGISKTSSNHIPVFIKKLDYEPNKSKAKVLGWPYTKFPMTITDFVYPVGVCEVPNEVCADSYLTESDDYFVTESNDCLILQ